MWIGHSIVTPDLAYHIRTCCLANTFSLTATSESLVQGWSLSHSESGKSECYNSEIFIFHVPTWKEYFLLGNKDNNLRQLAVKQWESSWMVIHILKSGATRCGQIQLSFTKQSSVKMFGCLTRRTSTLVTRLLLCTCETFAFSFLFSLFVCSDPVKSPKPIVCQGFFLLEMPDVKILVKRVNSNTKILLFVDDNSDISVI